MRLVSREMVFMRLKIYVFLLLFAFTADGMVNDYLVVRKAESNHEADRDDWVRGCCPATLLCLCCGLGIPCCRDQFKRLRWIRTLENEIKIYDEDRLQVPCLCQALGPQVYTSSSAQFFNWRDPFYGDGCCFCYKICCVKAADQSVKEYLNQLSGREKQYDESTSDSD